MNWVYWVNWVEKMNEKGLGNRIKEKEKSSNRSDVSIQFRNFEDGASVLHSWELLVLCCVGSERRQGVWKIGSLLRPFLFPCNNM